MKSQAAQCPFNDTSVSTTAESTPVPQDGQPSGAGAEAPAADWLDAGDLVADPYAAYSRLREESPVAWVPQLQKFLVTSYSGCHAIEQDQETFSANVSGSTMNRAIGAQPMLRKDDPEHAAERAPINPVLRPKSIKEAWAPIFARNAETYLDALEDKGPAVADLNADYAAPLASKNLIDLLGLHDTDIHQVRRWSHDFIAGMGNVLDDPAIWARCDASTAEADALLEKLIPFYRRNPDASLVSALANSGLPTQNVAANVKLAISGGMNEPQHMITNMVWALSLHPAQREAVLAEPSLWAAAFDETVRWQSPIGMYPRQTTRATVLDGVGLPAGAGIGVVVAAANRDQTHVGDDAERFDIHRPKRPHLAFGAGVHLCAGHWAAKSAIGQIAVPKAYERLPALRLDETRPERWDGWVFRGLSRLPVTWN